MPADISIIEVEGRPVVRADSWDMTNRHWLSYFEINDEGSLELYSTAKTQYEPTETDLSNDNVSENVQNTLEEAGFDLA
jgi:hypothetical protein